MARLLLKKPQGIPTNGLVAEYRFNEGSGQVLTNYRSTATSGTLGTTTAADAADPTWATSGLYFNTDDLVDLGQFTETNAGRTELSAFVVWKPSSSPLNSTIIGRFNTATPKRSWRMCVNDTALSRLDVVLSANGSSNAKVYTYINVFSTTNTTRWYMVGFTFSSGELTGYVRNTTPTPTKTADAACLALADASTEKLYIGCDTSTRFITGNVAYALLYNRAVTQTEVNQIYGFFRSSLRSRGVSFS